MRFQLLTVMLVAALAAGCSKKMSDEKALALARTTIHAKCKAAGLALPNAAPDKVERFCSCSTERVVVALGAAGIQALVKTETLTDDHKRMMREASQTCAAQLSRP